MLICFTGMDATGKTLYSQWLCRLLSDSGKEVTYIHILSPKGSVLRGLISDLRIGSEIKERVMADFYKPKGSLAKLLPVVTLIDSFVTYFISLKPMSKQSVVICDRYFYDLMAIWTCIDLLSLNTAYTFINAMPKPDVLLMLEVNSKTAYNRKREHPLSFYEAQWEFYQGMKRILKPICIDTEKWSIKEVKELILKNLSGVTS